MNDKDKKYPEGYFIGIGIALGVLFGIPLAFSLENMAYIGTGFPIGLAIGIALEEKYKKEGRIRPLNENKKKTRKIGLIAGTGALIIGIIALLILLSRYLF